MNCGQNSRATISGKSLPISSRSNTATAASATTAHNVDAAEVGRHERGRPNADTERCTTAAAAKKALRSTLPR